jgi:hypothetical protein
MKLKDPWEYIKFIDNYFHLHGELMWRWFRFEDVFFIKYHERRSIIFNINNRIRSFKIIFKKKEHG